MEFAPLLIVYPLASFSSSLEQSLKLERDSFSDWWRCRSFFALTFDVIDVCASVAMACAACCRRQIHRSNCSSCATDCCQFKCIVRDPSNACAKRKSKPDRERRRSTRSAHVPKAVEDRAGTSAHSAFSRREPSGKVTVQIAEYRARQRSDSLKRCCSRNCEFCTKMVCRTDKGRGRRYRVRMSMESYDLLRTYVPQLRLPDLTERRARSTGVIVHGSVLSMPPGDMCSPLHGLMAETNEVDALTTLSRLTISSSCQQYIDACRSSCEASMSIRDTILAFIATNFDKVSATPDFALLSLDDIVSLLHSRYVAVPERMLFERSMNWAQRTQQSTAGIATLLQNFRFALVPLVDVEQLAANSVASLTSSFSSMLKRHAASRPMSQSSLGTATSYTFDISGLITRAAFAKSKSTGGHGSTCDPVRSEFYFTAHGFAWAVLAEVCLQNKMLQMGAFLRCLRVVADENCTLRFDRYLVYSLPTTYRFKVYHACRGTGGGLRMCAATQVGTVDMMEAPSPDYAWWGEPRLLSQAQLEAIGASEHSACLSLDIYKCKPSSVLT